MEELGKKTTNMSEGARSPYRYLNQISHEYEAGFVPTRQRRSAWYENARALRRQLAEGSATDWKRGILFPARKVINCLRNRTECTAAFPCIQRLQPEAHLLETRAAL